MNRRGNILEALIATAQNYTSSTRWFHRSEPGLMAYQLLKEHSTGLRG